jgi:predicted RNA-binding protein YlqC (UPF0109 family)
MSSIDQQFIEFVVKSLVNNPDAVQVERRIDEKGVLLELTVDPEDLGRVIGKRGGTAQSIRTLLRALGTKNDARYNLKIIDNGVGEYARHEGEQPAATVPATPSGGASVSDDAAVVTKEETTTTSKATNNDLSDLDDDQPKPPTAKSHDDMVSKTRRELADLDDLEI